MASSGRTVVGAAETLLGAGGVPQRDVASLQA
jgi:hypothetical protein